MAGSMVLGLILMGICFGLALYILLWKRKNEVQDTQFELIREEQKFKHRMVMAWAELQKNSQYNIPEKIEAEPRYRVRLWNR